MDKRAYYYNKACIKDIRAYIDIANSKVKLDVEYLVEDDNEKGILAIEGIDITKILPCNKTPSAYRTDVDKDSDCKILTEQGAFQGDFIDYELKSYKVKVMTKSEIEKALGYKIEIMED